MQIKAEKVKNEIIFGSRQRFDEMLRSVLSLMRSYSLTPIYRHIKWTLNTWFPVIPVTSARSINVFTEGMKGPRCMTQIELKIWLDKILASFFLVGFPCRL